MGVGFFGNEEAHNGILKFAQAGEDAENTIYNVQEQVCYIVMYVLWRCIVEESYCVVLWIFACSDFFPGI